MSDETKACSKCRAMLPLTTFHRRAPGKLASNCKECARAKTRAWHAANKDRAQTYVATHREQILAYQRAWSAGRKRTPEQKARERDRYPVDRDKRIKAARESKARRKDVVNAQARADRDQLKDAYIRGMLRQGGWLAGISDHLIAMKREQVKMRRAVKQLISTIKEKQDGTK